MNDKSCAKVGHQTKTLGWSGKGTNEGPASTQKRSFISLSCLCAHKNSRGMVGHGGIPRSGT